MGQLVARCTGKLDHGIDDLFRGSEHATEPGEAGQTDDAAGQFLFDRLQAAKRVEVKRAAPGHPPAQLDRCGDRDFDVPHLQFTAADDGAVTSSDQRVLARMRATCELFVRAACGNI